MIANKTVPADRIKAYADAGYNVLLAPINRHAEVDHLMQPTGAIGVLSGDVEYVAGHMPNHPLYANYPYRGMASAFQHSTIVHGLMGPDEHRWWDQVHPARRGLMPKYLVDPANPPNPDPRGQYVLGKDAHNEQYPQWVLQGWCCPIPKVNEQDDLGFAFDLSWWANVYRNWEGGQQIAAEVAFCRATDEPFKGFEQSTDKSGYVVSYRTRAGGGKEVALVAWNHAANATIDLVKWDVSKVDNDWVAFRIHVRDDGITLAIVDRDTGLGLPEWPPYTTAQDTDPNKKRLGKIGRVHV